ncbi:PliI family lysozyme inhibitor of I-type lysozyme [Chitinibacter sp. S2-10]|uniref:PliI family lysozyme inhibitor of I-type lysozyme n=1 Tax=Chitinibacter sp. S2-10 TaxID=3373597 RepID=UPI003977D734
MKNLFFVLLLCSAFGAQAKDVASPKLNRFVLPVGNGTVVVAEGENEPRSIGSYSIRLYGGQKAKFPFDEFLAGQIFPRNGTIEQVLSSDVDENGVNEVLVVTRSAGTGSFLSVDVFSWQNAQLSRLLTLADIAANADPVLSVKNMVR